jgi:hypothetical protein
VKDNFENSTQLKELYEKRGLLLEEIKDVLEERSWIVNKKRNSKEI